MTYSIKRTDSEIDAVLNQAVEAEETGTQFPAMSFEQGITAGIMWAIGETEDNPFE